MLIISLISFVSIAQNSQKNTLVLISTTLGDIKISLYNETPKHRDNFMKLAKDGALDGTLFHRVIQNFMIQGGDPDSKNAKPGSVLGEGGLGYTVPAEFVRGIIHKKGVLAAAREGDDVNPQKASSSTQFYIVQGRTFKRAELEAMLKSKNANTQNKFEYTEEQIKIYETLGGTPHLDMNYTVFGEVVEGLDVVDKIAAVKTDKRDRPVEDIKMTVKLVKK
ncbi:MAG: peptidylprolyl isomerase [Flavobacteriales bacterium]|nr:peptidylprolyl isomerase [Flavobacteriales bacterium]